MAKYWNKNFEGQKGKLQFDNKYKVFEAVIQIITIDFIFDAESYKNVS